MHVPPQDTLVDLKGLLSALSLKSRSSYYAYARRPGFPRAVRVNGPKSPLKFKLREVTAFIDSLDAGE